MFRRIPNGDARTHLGVPSPATIIALIALFVAVGGSAYAAINLPANSVGTKQIKNRAVTAGKLANNAVTSAKVKDRSLLAKDFKRGQLPAGPRGPQGPKGDSGQQGPPGPSSGAAGGDLSGSYPNPTIAGGAVTPRKLGTIPQVRVETPAQSIPTFNNTTYTPVVWTKVVYNNAGFFHSTQPDRITVPATGVYAITAGANWTTNQNGLRIAVIQTSGSVIASSIQPATGLFGTAQSIATQYELHAGDTLRLLVTQTSGGDLNVFGPVTSLAMTWVGHG